MGNLGSSMAWWRCGVSRLMHCLVEVRVGELDPRQCLMEGRETFAVATPCVGALVCPAWSIPDVHHSNSGGVVVSVANETVEFASVEGGIVHWGEFVARGRGGGDSGSVVESRHDVHAEG